MINIQTFFRQELAKCLIYRFGVNAYNFSNQHSNRSISVFFLIVFPASQLVPENLFQRMQIFFCQFLITPKFVHCNISFMFFQVIFYVFTIVFQIIYRIDGVTLFLFNNLVLYINIKRLCIYLVQKTDKFTQHLSYPINLHNICLLPKLYSLHSGKQWQLCLHLRYPCFFL